MPRRFGCQELSFDMHQVLSTQSSPGNLTSLYSLSLAVDHLDAIPEVVLIQSPRSLSQSKTSLLVFDHYVHTHVTIVCSASDTHYHHYVLRVWHAYGTIIIMCSAFDTHVASSSMRLRHQVSPSISYDASRARRRFSPSSRSKVFSSSEMFHSTEIPEQCITGSPAMFHSTSSF